MDKRLFGTDGIRGRYGVDIDGDIAYRLGNSLARRGSRIVVGRDTRLTGGELYKYLRKGILDAGSDIIYLGIVPTPVVAYVTTHARADYGVVITASHNPPEYNGLKVFRGNGMKLTDEEEIAIEHDMDEKIFVSNKRGVESYDETHIEEYKNRLLDTFLGISGQNIGIDLGNGAVSVLGKDVVGRIFGEAVFLNDEGNGRLINMRSGALHPEGLVSLVRERHLDMGFAFDGDGDRIIAVTHEGNIVNGDRMIYAIARYLRDKGELVNNLVVGTPYTNMGVVRDLESHGISVIRSDVGDSNVALSMSIAHASLGGERAGHIIMSRYGMTGDALLVALVLASIVAEKGESLEEITACHEYPTVSGDFIEENAHDVVERATDIIEEARLRLGDQGRIIVRSSGTEPKIRAMVEAEDESLARDILDDTIAKIKGLAHV